MSFLKEAGLIMNKWDQDKRLKELERTTQKIKLLAQYEIAKKTDFNVMKLKKDTRPTENKIRPLVGTLRQTNIGCR